MIDPRGESDLLVGSPAPAGTRVDRSAGRVAVLELSVLGPLQVRRGGVEVDLGSRKQRRLLAGLALTPNRVVSADALVEMVWGDRPPPAVTASVHGYIAALRRALEPGRVARDRPQILLTRPDGYELNLGPAELDASRFAATVVEVHHGLAGGDGLLLPDGHELEELGAAESDLETALAAWRGSPFAELPDHPTATAERARLEDLKLLAHHDLARVRLALGRHAAVVGDLESLTRQYPLREDLWGLRAVALVRAGRQADALDTLRTARTVLADELGIDPGPTLRELEVAILRQDASIVRGQPSPRAEESDGPRPPARAVPARPEQPGPTPRHPAGELPLVGRDRELAALEELLAAVQTGLPRAALVTGEPGIGKTRLTSALAESAAARGFTVLRGRCSQDEGAPPLWPWVGVLRQLAQTWPAVSIPALDPTVGTSGEPTPGDRFRLFDEVARLLIDLTDQRPLLLVFDDLHWADPSSLHLLRHLVETADQGRLLIAATRRSHSEPHPALVLLGEALARRAALRLDLVGLTQPDVEVLVEAAGEAAAAQDAASLRERTGGNPFFLVELLRLGDTPARPQRSGDVPAAIGDVITARVAQLPQPTQGLLRDAAVIGRDLDLGLLGRLTDRSEVEVVDVVEPAVAAGVVVEGSDGRLQFSHALVRDALYASVPARRRQLRHADIARVLEEVSEPDRRLSEISRHWLRAGPAHAGRAWRTAMAAAAYATRLLAHEEAADLLSGALERQEADPAAGPTERYELVMALARASRASANSDRQRSATAEAIRLALAADDVERVALAAITSSQGALWSNRPMGEVDQLTVAALHRATRELPGGDTPLRCQVFLALSRELYWSAQPQQREAYAEVGLAMARRIGQPQLHAWACHTAFVAAFRPHTLDARIALAAEAVAASREAGDAEGESIGLFLTALVRGEAGMLDERADAVRRALDLAAHHRFRYLQVMLAGYEVPWLALHGRFSEAEELYASAVGWAAHTSFPFRDEALAAARLCLDLWQGRAGSLLPVLTGLDDAGPVDMRHAILLLLLRAAGPGEVAAHLERRPPTIRDDTFEAPMILALCAEAALVVGDKQLAGQMYPLLAPWAGRFASAGTGAPLGPVDAFLALAAAAVGEMDLAARHAARALELCTRWQLTPVAGWLSAHRSAFGF